LYAPSQAAEGAAGGSGRTDASGSGGGSEDKGGGGCEGEGEVEGPDEPVALGNGEEALVRRRAPLQSDVAHASVLRRKVALRSTRLAGYSSPDRSPTA
jgi:hypothetical protein